MLAATHSACRMDSVGVVGDQGRGVGVLPLRGTDFGLAATRHPHFYLQQHLQEGGWASPFGCLLAVISPLT